MVEMRGFNMKKIFALLLIACLAMSFVACKDKTPEQTPADVSAFTSAIAATNPNGAVITVKTTDALGDLNAKYTVAYNADGTATVEYTSEVFNTFSADNTEIKSTKTGTVTVAADGSYTGGEGMTGNVASIAAGTAIDLTAVAATATINAAGDILTATVPAASTESVLGAAVASDVTLVITISAGVVEQVNITYTGVVIECKYN